MRKQIHLLFVALFLYSLSTSSLRAQNEGSFSLEIQAGELASKLPTNKNEVHDLTLKGALNSSDLSVLRTLPQMSRLDMREVTIEPGGDGYTSGYYPGQTLQVEKTNALPKALFAGKESLQSILLPTRLVEIGDGAFRASGLTYIQLPESVTTVGERAFAECVALSKAKLHTKLSKIAHGLFEGCTALTTLQNSKITEVGDNAFRGCKSLKFTLPGGVTHIGDKAFQGCESLEIAYLTNTVAYLGNHAFDGCSSLSMIFIKANIATLGEYIFANCPKLVNINTPYDFTTLPKGMFSGCGALKEVWLGSGLKEVGAEAFENCTALTTLRIDNPSAPTVDATAFAGVNCRSVELLIPNGKSALYSAHDEWKNFQVKELALGDNGVKVATIYQKSGTSKSLKVGIRTTLPLTFNLGNGSIVKKAPGTYSSAKKQVDCTNGGKTVELLSMPSALRDLIINDLDGNDIEQITFNAPDLDYLWLTGSQITSLDLSQMPKLRQLNIYDNALLEILNLSHNPELTYLDISFAEKIQNLDLSATPKLTTLKAAQTKLSTWDLSKVPLITELDLSMTKIQSLDLSALTRVQVIMLPKCELEHLTFPSAPDLKEVFINDNKLSADELNAIYKALPQREAADEAKIYIKNNPGAETSNTGLLKGKNWVVDMEGTGTDTPDLTQEAISFFTANKTVSFNVIGAQSETLSIDWGDGSHLERATVTPGMQKNLKHTFETTTPQHEVKIYGKSITTLSSTLFNVLGLTNLDVTHCPTLQKLAVPNGNDLLSVDLSKNNELTHIDLAGCKLNTITLPEEGAKIQELKLSTNDIRELDLKGMSALEVLSAPSNKLKEIDLTPCPKLRKINLNLNGLEKVIGLKELTELTDLDIANNTLPFSMLPPRKNMTTYVYSQYWYDIPSELIKDYTIDLSAEYRVQGVTDQPEQTSYKWYIQKTMTEKVEVPQTAYTEQNGVFTFNDTLFPQGSEKVEIFVLMTNPSFPDINKKSQGLRSGFITMKRIHVEEPLDPSKFDTKFEGIYENAFAESKNLIEIKLPKNTKEIRHKAFSNCPKLQAVVIGAQVDKLSEKAFEDREGLVIYVPTEAVKSDVEKIGKFKKTKVVVGDSPVANNTITAGRAYNLTFEGATLILSSLTAESQEVALYDLQGHSIARTTLPGNSAIRLTLPQSGCYVLAIQGEVSKVFIP